MQNFHLYAHAITHHGAKIVTLIYRKFLTCYFGIVLFDFIWTKISGLQ